MSRVLVTGASGFIGMHLCDSLVARGHNVIGTTRATAGRVGHAKFRLVTVGNIGEDVDWEPILEDVHHVVHLAARVHVMHESEGDPLSAFRRVNVEGTERLLRSNGMASVKNVVFVSTVKVHGESADEIPFSVEDKTTPTDAYARSKLEAEHLVRSIGEDVGFAATIIRPPLVYGPGVGGNFLRLMQFVHKGIPLPLGRIDNQRSLVSVGNLCDLVCQCLKNPAAAGKRFLVSDNEDISTPELVQFIASSMSKSARLLPVPVPLLRLLAGLTGKGAEVSRLTESLRVDIDDTIRTLDWRPPLSVEHGIRSTVEWFERSRQDA